MADPNTAIAQHDHRLVEQSRLILSLRARHASPSEFATAYASLRTANQIDPITPDDTFTPIHPTSIRVSEPAKLLTAAELRGDRPDIAYDPTPQLESELGPMLDQLLLAAEMEAEGGSARLGFDGELAVRVEELESRRRELREEALDGFLTQAYCVVHATVSDIDAAELAVFLCSEGRRELVEAAGGRIRLGESVVKAEEEAVMKMTPAKGKGKGKGRKNPAKAKAKTAPAPAAPASRKRKAAESTAATALTELGGVVGGAEMEAAVPAAPQQQQTSHSGRALKLSSRAQEAQTEAAAAKPPPRKRARVGVSPAPSGSEGAGEVPTVAAGMGAGEGAGPSRRPRIVLRVRELPGAAVAPA
ncbi:hypothetical protein B0A55_02119 [Friedmanniomyces simplex]|uniref:Uncharacterized protein n=1 Tax=Friedmanniomyces simplex TaxID=329884 RepID=A0A4U0XLC3_9PEZI|nr:hypothetical protein B0A55_02119 [Friedmanniomyces simplex]